MSDFEELTTLTGLKADTLEPKQAKKKKVEVPDIKKVTTSIIIAEDVRQWLRIKGIETNTSMSQLIEDYVRKEMKKEKG